MCNERSLTDFFPCQVCQNEDSSSGLGPTIIISHETKHTDVLTTSNSNAGAASGRCEEELLRERFSALGEDVSAFRRIRYHLAGL